MKKFDLEKYIAAFDVESGLDCYCWGCLIKEVDDDIRDLTEEVLSALGPDAVPDFITLKAIHGVFREVRNFSRLGLLEWYTKDVDVNGLHIENALSIPESLMHIILTTWMKHPSSPRMIRMACELREPKNAYESVFWGHMYFMMQIHRVVKAHIAKMEKINLQKYLDAFDVESRSVSDCVCEAEALQRKENESNKVTIE